mgnify:CR=1 FL=1
MYALVTYRAQAGLRSLTIHTENSEIFAMVAPIYYINGNYSEMKITKSQIKKIIQEEIDKQRLGQALISFIGDEFPSDAKKAIRNARNKEKRRRRGPGSMKGTGAKQRWDEGDPITNPEIWNRLSDWERAAIKAMGPDFSWDPETGDKWRRDREPPKKEKTPGRVSLKPTSTYREPPMLEKLTKSQLKKIIQEEIEGLLDEVATSFSTTQPRLGLGDTQLRKPAVLDQPKVATPSPAAEPKYTADAMTRNRREAALHWDLGKWDNAGAKGKFKVRQLGSGYTDQHAAGQQDSYEKLKAAAAQPGWEGERAKRATGRHGVIGTEAGQPNLGTSPLLPGEAERYFDPGMGAISNLRTGLSKAQKNVLYDRMSRSGAWKQLRMDDPIRADYRNWIQTRMGRGKKK